MYSEDEQDSGDYRRIELLRRCESSNSRVCLLSCLGVSVRFLCLCVLQRRGTWTEGT